MRRSSSIGGLLIRLAGLHVRRRPWWIGAAVLVGAFGLAGSDEVQAPREAVQAAVLPDGFVALHGEVGARRLIEVDRNGQARRDVGLDVAGELRVVGTRGGVAVGWLEGAKVQLARVGDDGTLEDRTAWGKSARQLCAGVASNDQRFAIGWVEAADGHVWFVHGPTAQGMMTEDPPVEIHDPFRASWCGLASAGSDLGLLWKGKDRLALTFCGKRECSEIPVRVALDPSHEVTGFGCLRDTCLIATRDRGVTRLNYVSRLGKVKWSRVLEIKAGTSVSIVGATQSFAVATVTAEGARVSRYARDGAESVQWTIGEASASAPALAWAAGKLVIAYERPGAGATYVMAWPG